MPGRRMRRVYAGIRCASSEVEEKRERVASPAAARASERLLAVLGQDLTTQFSRVSQMAVANS